MSETHLKMKPSNLRAVFNWESIKSKGLSLFIKEVPCLGLSFASALGVSNFNHDPCVELAVAIGVAIGFEYIEHKYFPQIQPLISGFGPLSIAKRYGLALAIGVAGWGLHQAAFHHDDNHDHGSSFNSDHIHIERQISACDGPNQYLLRFPKSAHDKAHEHDNTHNHTHASVVCAFR